LDTRIVRREERKVCERGLKLWGVKAQLDKATQEAAELAAAICKYDERRDVQSKRDLVNEMADCSVMIDVLKIILSFTDEEFQIVRADKYRAVIERLAVEGV